ncbi:MAG: hypothetical protein IJT96_08845 [Lachnospiraceae bacterium]|nr:hypothetical protein [Lachnospiraceae bacterium]
MFNGKFELTGATELSEMAFALEQAGKDGDMKLIDSKTPELLDMYRSLKEPLERVVEIWDEQQG